MILKLKMLRTHLDEDFRPTWPSPSVVATRHVRPPQWMSWPSADALATAPSLLTTLSMSSDLMTMITMLHWPSPNQPHLSWSTQMTSSRRRSLFDSASRRRRLPGEHHTSATRSRESLLFESQKEHEFQLQCSQSYAPLAALWLVNLFLRSNYFFSRNYSKL